MNGARPCQDCPVQPKVLLGGSGGPGDVVPGSDACGLRAGAQLEHGAGALREVAPPALGALRGQHRLLWQPQADVPPSTAAGWSKSSGCLPVTLRGTVQIHSARGRFGYSGPPVSCRSWRPRRPTWTSGNGLGPETTSSTPTSTKAFGSPSRAPTRIAWAAHGTWRARASMGATCVRVAARVHGSCDAPHCTHVHRPPACITCGIGRARACLPRLTCAAH